MKVEEYLRQATKEIYQTQTRNEVAEELRTCIEDLKEGYISRGISPQEAEEQAVAQMGSPDDVRMEFHRIYRPKIEWKQIIYLIIWVAVLGAAKLFWVSNSGGVDGNGFSDENLMTLIVIRYCGIGLLVLGLCLSAAEKYMDLPIFYAWAANWNGGGIVNASMIAAGGIAGICQTLPQLIVLTCCTVIIMQAERLTIARLREQKEQQYLWEICTAEESFDFEGKVRIEGKTKKVRIKRGEKVEKGEQLIIVGINGFRLLVESA